MSVPTTLLCTSEAVQRIYMNTTTRSLRQLLAPQDTAAVPLGVRAAGCSFGGLALGVAAHRYCAPHDDLRWGRLTPRSP
jgi:hypothetical protein